MVKYIVSKLVYSFIFYELSVHEGKYEKKNKKGKIINLSDHDKLINLIAIHNEKDVNIFFNQLTKYFIEVFNIKKKDLPWSISKLRG